MKWEIREFSLAAESAREDLALLVKDDGGSTRVLPGGSALHLHSHLTIHPPPPRACGAPLGVFHQG